MHGSGPVVDDDELALTSPVEVPVVETSVVPVLLASVVLDVGSAVVPVVGSTVVVGRLVVGSVALPSVTDADEVLPVVAEVDDGSVIVALVVGLLSSAHPVSAGPDNASE